MVRLCRQSNGFSVVRGAYRFLSLLGDEILEIAEDHILTKQKENYQLLMWNYCDYTEAFAKGDRSSLSLLDRDGAFDEKPACVRANVPLQGHYLQTVYILDKSTSVKRIYLIFGMCDESFSINCTADIPQSIDRGWFYFFVTLLNHIYWVTGATLGGLFGALFTFNTEGLDFVMTAMFVVIFLEQWQKDKQHTPALLGLLLSAVCLVVFGADNFILPAMAAILLALTLLRSKLERGRAA